MNTALQASYDEFPYQSIPFRQSHPDRLATLARLFGLSPKRIDESRVLEIGCASGGNLIPMAASLRRSEFIGIDFSAMQVRQGVADIEALGLTNVRLLNMNLLDFGDEFGEFDYIIAHGVYSWVPPDVQAKLLAVCARQLAPDGIAYVSYNTLPGWNMRGVIRDAMLFHTRQFPDAHSRVLQARATLDFLAQSVHSADPAYAMMLRSEAEIVRRKGDYYVLHDHLEEVNEPLYFHQFIERASRHRLRFLAEADFNMMLLNDFAPKVVETLARIAPEVLKREQYIDFLRNRHFRQTLLVREDVQFTNALSPERTMSLWIASEVRATNPGADPRSSAAEEFRTPNGSGIKTPHPISKAAMAILARCWPASIHFADLCAMAATQIGLEGIVADAQRTTLVSDMLRCFAVGAAELHSIGPAFVIEAGARPQASALARLQAVRGSPVTNLRHEPVAVDDADRRLLPLLDGVRLREEIAAQEWDGQPAGDEAGKLDQALARLARQAFLVQ